MNDKKIKEAMKQYIETQADNISSESEEKHDLTSLDKRFMQCSAQIKTSTKRLLYGLLER